MMKTLKNPFMTTTWPLNERANPVVTVRRIQDKLFMYGIISEREQEYLDRFGRIDQKEPV